MVFFITKRSFPTKKTRNFYHVFLYKNEVSTVKYYFRCKVHFSTRKPRFGVETGIFITKRSFPTKKTRNFYKFFSTKTEASTVKYYFRCKVLFSTLGIFYHETVFSSEKNTKFLQVFLYKN